MIAGPYGSDKRKLLFKDFGRLIVGEYFDPQDIFERGPHESIERIRQRAYHARFRFVRKHKSFTTNCSLGSVRDLDLLDAAYRNDFDIALHYFGVSDWRAARDRIRSMPDHWLKGFPEDKLEGLYHRSLAMLPGAILLANRGAIYDHSETGHPRKLLNIVDGKVELVEKNIPDWLLSPLTRCL